MEITQLLKLNLHHNEKIAYQSPSILVATNKLNDDKNLLGKNIQVQEFALFNAQYNFNAHNIHE